MTRVALILMILEKASAMIVSADLELHAQSVAPSKLATHAKLGITSKRMMQNGRSVLHVESNLTKLVWSAHLTNVPNAVEISF